MKVSLSTESSEEDATKPSIDGPLGVIQATEPGREANLKAIVRINGSI
jgi:hypothetical protein